MSDSRNLKRCRSPTRPLFDVDDLFDNVKTNKRYASVSVAMSPLSLDRLPTSPSDPQLEDAYDLRKATLMRIIMKRSNQQQQHSMLGLPSLPTAHPGSDTVSLDQHPMDITPMPSILIPTVEPPQQQSQSILQSVARLRANPANAALLGSKSRMNSNDSNQIIAHRQPHQGQNRANKEWLPNNHDRQDVNHRAKSNRQTNAMNNNSSSETDKNGKDWKQRTHSSSTMHMR